MKHFVEELEKRDNNEKRQFIKNFLTYRSISFHSQPVRTLFSNGENIIVDYPFDGSNNSKKRIFLTAHYDTWFGAPGANDNASGVAVLLGFIERLLKEKMNQSLRIIFFDLEDRVPVSIGAKHYVRQFGTGDIDRIYNLEMVGMGKVLMLWPAKQTDVETGWLKSLAENAGKLGFSIVSVPTPRVAVISFPTERGFASDHIRFNEVGFEQACSLTTLPEEDLRFRDVLEGHGKLRFVRELLKYYFFKKGDVPTLLHHYHNQDDNSNFINQDTLNSVLNLLWETVLR